jgi:GT2 family glycosyltransferase
MSTLSIILVNYKRAQDTIECVRSLGQSTFTDYDIIIIDNGSSDASVERLNAECLEATVISTKVNLGFAEGNNVGIREALHRGSRQILLLNNDTIVDRNALAELSSSLASPSSIGIVGPKILYFDQPNVIWFAGAHLNIHSASYGHYGIGEADTGQYDTPNECDYITGCCLLFRREVAERIGLLDSAYFAYLEDADFCTRARHSGFAVMYQPKALIYHKISSTSSWDSPIYIYFNLRNKILFLRKHSSPANWIVHLPRIAYYYLRQFARLAFKWHDAAKSRAAWYGLLDGIRGRTGVHGEGRLDEILISRNSGQ